jgi:hypothetical protein
MRHTLLRTWHGHARKQHGQRAPPGRLELRLIVSQVQERDARLGAAHDRRAAPRQAAGVVGAAEGAASRDEVHDSGRRARVAAVPHLPPEVEADATLDAAVDKRPDRLLACMGVRGAGRGVSGMRGR